MILTIYKILILILFYIIHEINSKHLSKNLNNNLDSLSPSKFVENENDAMMFLSKFGYMDHKEGPFNMTPSQMKPMIMDYQRFMGLSETGALDEKTMQMMNMPRCGVADNISARTHGVYRKGLRKRFRRYQLQGSVWEVRNISWKVTQYSSRDTLRGKDREVDAIMDYALKEWGKHTRLNFMQERGNKKPTIEIKFTILDHRDGNPFDGPGKTLAHAFFPQFGGDTHFDDQESWSIDGGRGVDLLSVAVHEFGHALGLGHSDNKDSIMFPTYAGKRSKLKRDDINGIEMLYGKKISLNEERTHLDRNQNERPNVRQIAPDLCKDFRIDAADCNAKGECFFFRDDYIWRIDDDTGISPGYPKMISDIFPGLTGKIDAAVTDQDSGLTFIFKRDRVWTYSEPMREAISSNEPIAKFIRGLDTSNFDAATRWGFNGRMYLFKDEQYWRYDTDRRSRPISRRYPQSLRVWHGIPQNIDAAMFWPKTGKTYFFKGPYYYRFNDLTSSVDDANPSFPREASKWWLKCRRSNIKNSGLENNEIENDKKCLNKEDCDNSMDESNDPTAKDDRKFVNFLKSYVTNNRSRFSLARFVTVMKSLAHLLDKQ